MMRIAPLFPLLAGLLLAPAAALPGAAQARRTSAAPASAAAPTAVAEPGEIVFRLKPALKPFARPTAVEHPAVRAALAAVGAQAVRQPFPRAVPPDPKHPGGIDLTLTYRARVPVAADFDAVRRRLLATGAVAWVEPHYAAGPLFQPNDPFADSTLTRNQYYLKQIRAYRAWDVEDGDTAVVIGITDTGARMTHEDLASQIARNYADPPNGLDDDNDGYVDNHLGWDLADDDNDPAMDATTNPPTDPFYHGTRVAGVSSGAVNNGVGVAGVGYKCRFLPIKIYSSTPAGGFAGFEGIVYAADHGCRVINCSWGRVGYWSQYEQDCITYATRNRDAVVVVAAGNTNADLTFYPAAYEGALSVGFVDRNDVKAVRATYAHRIDLSAPGVSIITTDYINDADYTSRPVGSSVAAPQVAGAVALVRARFPTLTAAQAAERVRVAADTSIYALPGNAAFRERLGRGRLNVHRALADTTLRSVRLVRTTLSAVAPRYGGDTLTVRATFRNVLAPVAGLVVSLSSPTAGVQVLAGGPVSLGPLGTLDSVALPAGQAFRVVLPTGAAPNTPVALRFGFADAAGGYRDFQYVTLTLEPNFVTLDSTAIRATVTAAGDLGYVRTDPRYGFSVARQPDGDRLLVEGGLLVSADSGRVSDRLHGTGTGQFDDDFSVEQSIRFSAARPWEAQAASSIFADSAGPAQAGVRVLQRAWNSPLPGCTEAVVMEYAIINQTADTLRTLYAGLYADWDIGQAQHNRTTWDGARRLAAAFTTLAASPAPTSAWAGIKLLTAQPGAVYAFDNLNAAAPGPVNAADGLTAAEKWAALQAAAGAPTTAGTTSLGSDVAHLVRAALPPLAPGDTARVAFAVLATGSAADLTTAADSIQALFDATLAPAAPVGIGASRCGPGAATLTATNAPPRTTYRWYAQATGGAPLAATPTLPVTVAATDTFYVAARTTVGRESVPRTPVVVVVDTIPATPVLTATPQPTGTVLLTTGGAVAQFYLNGTALPLAPTDSLLLTTAAQNGVYTATVVSVEGCVSDTSNAVSVVITGLAEAAATIEATLYPNPTTADATLVLPGAARVAVLDAVGRVVFAADAPGGETRLPLAGLPRGVYAVRVQTARGAAVRRLLRE